MANLQLRADVFPSTIHITDAEGNESVYDKARVIVTLDHVYVFQDGTPRPQVVFEDRLTSYTPPVPATRVKKAAQLLDRSARFETEDGFNASFLRAGGCGCGSKLKTASLASLFPDSLAAASSTGDTA